MSSANYVPSVSLLQEKGKKHSSLSMHQIKFCTDRDEGTGGRKVVFL